MTGVPTSVMRMAFKATPSLPPRCGQFTPSLHILCNPKPNPSFRCSSFFFRRRASNPIKEAHISHTKIVQENGHSSADAADATAVAVVGYPTISAFPPSISPSLFNALACVVAVSASCLFLAAIPTLILPSLVFFLEYLGKAFKKAADSLERLLISTREELPETMAAVRLSGMEISDLTMELSDLGQEITKGFKNSTRAFKEAKHRVRHMTNMVSIGSKKSEQRIMEKTLAMKVRSLHETIVQGRRMYKGFLLLHYLSSWLRSRRRKRGG